MIAVPNMLQERWEERKKDFTEEEKKNAWDETAKVVKTYSDETVARWIAEMDTLLVYVRSHIREVGVVERKVLTVSYHRRASSRRYSLPSTSSRTRCCCRLHQIRSLQLLPRYRLNSQASPFATHSSTLPSLHFNHRLLPPTLPPRSDGPYG